MLAGVDLQLIFPKGYISAVRLWGKRLWLGHGCAISSVGRFYGLLSGTYVERVWQ